MIQPLSDKSQISLTAYSFYFYPLHVTLLNMPGKDCNSLIVSGKSVVTYLPVTFYRQQNDNKNKVAQKKHFRTDVITVLHDSIERALSRLREVSVYGFKCKIFDDICFKCHSVLCSHVVNLPKTEDLLSSKKETQTMLLCHRFLVPRISLSETTSS